MLQSSIEARIGNLLRQLEADGVDAFWIIQPENRRYLSGFTAEDPQLTESSGSLIIGPRERLLLTDSRYTEQAKAEATAFDIITVKGDLIAEFPQILSKIGCRRLGFEAGYLIWGTYEKLKKVIEKEEVGTVLVPLENRVDYLTLHNGRKVEIPFDVMVVFSTNLPPKDLVDEAFLRRLRHKIKISNPSYEEYRQIFRAVAQTKHVQYSDQGLAYLLQEWYIKKKRPLRANHPRDLCDHIIDIAQFYSIKPVLKPDMIDRAASSYFVDLN